MTLYKWSQTAANDASADPTINWAEGMAPSAINDSARAMMAAISKYRDDTNGSITTGGTSSAYTVATSQGFDTTAHMTTQSICFSVHLTNAATPTLNVDGLGAFPIRNQAGTSVPAGTLILGSPYRATFFNSTGEWVLEGFYGNPFNIPIAGMMDFIGSSVPNSSFVFPFGQAISRVTYATLFGLTGTTYGVGDGSTTFNIPDLRGRVAAGKDNMGGSGAGRLQAANGGLDGTGLGNAGGADTQTLTTAQIPAGIPVSVSGSVSVTSTVSNILASNGPADNWQSVAGSTSFDNQFKTAITSTGSNSMTGTASGSGGAHTIVQPTIIVNKILRII